MPTPSPGPVLTALLGNRLAELGDREEALQVSREYLAAALGAARVTRNPALAVGALMDHAEQLVRSGDPRGAREALESAEHLLEPIAAQHPAAAADLERVRGMKAGLQLPGTPAPQPK